MIIVGYQGIGKSTLANNMIGRYIDLESGCFWNDGKRPNDWYVYYCNVAIHLESQGYIVFVSSHEVVRKYLESHINVNALCIIPSIELKDGWIKKLKSRYDASGLEKDYKAYMNAVDRYEDSIKEIMEGELPYIEIKSIEYDLHNIICPS